MRSCVERRCDDFRESCDDGSQVVDDDSHVFGGDLLGVDDEPNYG